MAGGIGQTGSQQDIHRGYTFPVQGQTAKIIGIAAKFMVTSHPAKDSRGFIPTDKRERLVKGMRSRIEQNAAQVALKGLPIPAPPETTPDTADMHEFTQHAGLNDLLDLVEKRLEPVVLEGRQHALG